MSRLRLLLLLVTASLAISSLASPACAHPGHDADGESAVGVPVRPALGEEGAGGPPPHAPRGPRHHAPPAVALVAGALALLANLPHRRRTLAIALALLLALTAFEGAAHAALHLRHVPHTDGLAIGVSASPQASVDLDGTVPAVSPLVPLGEVVERGVAPAVGAIVAANQGRAPPVFPA
ncbi:MAG TPA: hypothetical protein VMS64_19790 [Candidatus Methylomirabilis sp.]|nr:hypothetical protein [Candidatus Methylomirabilis sp.]